MNFLTFMTAMTPWHLTCKHCKIKLKLEKYKKRIMLFIIVFAGVIGFYIGWIHISLKMFLLVAFSAVMVLEIAVFFIVKLLNIKLIERKIHLSSPVDLCQ